MMSGIEELSVPTFIRKAAEQSVLYSHHVHSSQDGVDGSQDGVDE
jgi:hypothetical protein